MSSETSGKKRILPYIIILASFVIGIILIVLMIDKIVMPVVVHDKPTVTVPEIKGKPLSQAISILKSKGLEYQVSSEQYSGDYPPETVINQVPVAGEEVKISRPIYVTLSKGKETVKVPWLKGLPVRKARVEAIQKGLQLGNITYEFSELFGKDTVIGQSKGPDSEVAYGYNLDIVVSKGSEKQSTIPNIIGLNLSEAEAKLAETGFIIGTITTKSSETYLPNTVIDQSPSAGEFGQVNSAIDIVITK